MADQIDVGDHSRRFRLAVLVATLFVLLAAALAVAALDVSPGGLGLGGSSLPGEVSGEAPEAGGADPPPIDPGSVDFGEMLAEADIDVEWILEHGNEIPEDELPAGLEPAEIPPPPYDIAVDPKPVPGNEATVTVTKDGEAVPGVIVSFGDTPVGVTGPGGQVTAPVPYVTELTVTAEPITIRDEGGDDDRGGDGTDGTLAAAGVPTALADGPATASAPSAVQTQNATATFTVPTDVSVVPAEPPLPGESVEATVEYDGRSIPNLNVYVAGEFVGMTDDNGTVTLVIPESVETGGTVAVRVAQNEFAGTTALDIAEIEIAVDPGLIGLPGTGAEVAVRAVDGERETGVAGVPVTVTDGGTTIAEGRTDEDGTVSIGLPWSNSVQATATAYGTTVSTTQSGMLYSLAVVLAAALFGLIAAGVWLGRNPDTLGAAGSRLVAVVVAAGAVLRRAGSRLATVVARVRAALAQALARLTAALSAGIPSSPLQWLLVRARAVSRRLLWAVLTPYRRFVAEPSGDHSDPAAPTTTAAGEASPEPTASAEPVGAYRRLLRCWQWLVSRVVGRSRTKTAIEVERRALEAGFPERPVRRLRRAFQDVEYGFAEPEETVESAEEAVDHLRADEEEAE